MPTEKEIATRVAAGAHIDPERVSVRTEGDTLVVGVAALTEGQHRAARAVMTQYVGDHRDWKVVRDETPDKPPAYDLDALRDLMNHLGAAPDGQLDKMFTARIRATEFTDLDQTLKFLRNLRDECVYCAGASGFVMQLFSMVLEDYPEPQDVMDERRAELERTYGM